MSLIDPNIIDKIAPYKAYLIIGGLAMVLIIVAMWMSDCGSNWSFNRGVNNINANIQNNINAIKNANVQIANLEQQKSAAQANINAETKQYQDAVYGREEAKQQTDQALANLNKAINANANIDASANDVLKALDKLNQ